MAENLVIKQNQEKQNLIRAAFKSACIAEIKALKPGNVHIFSNGHGMTVEDFMVSAKISAEEISAIGISLGERIFNSVSKTVEQVGCNTNLGIILLCAPISQALFSKQGAINIKNIQKHKCSKYNSTNKIIIFHVKNVRN